MKKLLDKAFPLALIFLLALTSIALVNSKKTKQSLKTTNLNVEIDFVKMNSAK